MAITTQDGWLAAIGANGQFPETTKLVPSVGVANVPHSLWVGAGNPSAGGHATTGRANGRTLVDTTAGGTPFNNAPSGQMGIPRARMNPLAATCQGTIYLVDRISDFSVLLADAGGTVTSCDATSRLPAAAAGAEGAQIFIYAQTALGTATTFTLTYTNQAGTGSRVTPNIVSVASAIINRSLNLGLWVPLQAGDTGVRTIDSFTAVSGAGSGTICVCLVRPLLTIPIATAGIEVTRDMITETTGVPRIYDDSCLDRILVPTGAAAANTPMVGGVTLAYG